MNRPRLPALALVALVAGCAGGGPSTVIDPGQVPGDDTFSGGVQPIFTNSCAFALCHAGSDPQMGMNLSEGLAYANTVNVPSKQVPSLLRIAPGQPDSSYLVLKIEGRAGTVGGVPTRMPLGGFLTDAQIETIRNWVSNGAPNN